MELRGAACGYDGSPPVLSGLNMTVERGEFVGLLGPSGAGKTTLLRTLLGAARLFDGDALVEGRSVRERRPRAGYVPQLEAIDWRFPVTVEQAALMGRTAERWAFPWHSKRDKEAVFGMMERLGIAGLAKRHIRELSGGQRQRVFLARALASSPRLLLLDEPVMGVDIKTRDDALHLLHDLNHQGVTILMTTHEINAVAAHLPRVVCLNGSVVADGPPRDALTPASLKRAYGADLRVIEHDGMTMVTESPHRFGAAAHARGGSAALTPSLSRQTGEGVGQEPRLRDKDGRSDQGEGLGGGLRSSDGLGGNLRRGEGVGGGLHIGKGSGGGLHSGGGGDAGAV